jgi:glyoxylase-like metal-dependent hydrolase (beta-lactamase superfamily II)
MPTFPNARYLTGRREFEYWQQQNQEPGSDAVQLPSFEDSVLPIFEAGLLDLVDDGYELAEGLTLLPLPGHTPGQLGVRADGSAPAVFCGDAIHTPVQVLNPELSTNGYASRRPARRSGCSRSEDYTSGRTLLPSSLGGCDSTPDRS